MRAPPARRRVRWGPAAPAVQPLRQEAWSPGDGRVGAAVGSGRAGPAADGPAGKPVADTPAGSPVAAGYRDDAAGRVQPRGRTGTTDARAAATGSSWTTTYLHYARGRFYSRVRCPV